MPIYPLTYRHWDGQRTGWWARLRAFQRTGARAAWSGWFRKSVIVLAPMPIGIWMFFVWASAEYLFAPEEGLFNFVLDLIGNDASKAIRTHSETRAAFWTFWLYSGMTWPASFCNMIVIVVVGAGLIAADRRHHAHEIYFARQVGWWEYVLGKLSVIGFYLGIVFFLPAALLWLEILLFSPQWSDLWFLVDLGPRLVLCWAAWTVFAGLPMLALSSLSSSTVLAAFLWILVWIGSQLLSGIMQLIRMGVYMASHPDFRPRHREFRADPTMIPDAFRPGWPEGFSFEDNLVALHHGLIGGGSIDRHFGDMANIGLLVRQRMPGVSPWVALAVLGTVALGSLLILRWRVRPEGAA